MSKTHPTHAPEFRREVLTAVEREEPTHLRRDVRQLRLERGILSKAAVWFAWETHAVPSGSSGS